MMDVISRIKEYVKLIYICPHYVGILKGLKNSKGPKTVLIGTPAHGNLGDHSIAISELDFLRRCPETGNVIEIPMPLYKTHRGTIKKALKNSDVIIISGGGWMGNLWIHNEMTIREIITDHPDKRVIIFPQTLYYTDDEEGTNTLMRTREIIGRHPDLILTVREAASFDHAEKDMGLIPGESLFFCPDMAVYGTLAQKIQTANAERLAVVCFRDDIEKKRNNDYVRDLLREASYSVKETSTLAGRLITMRKREQAVVNKIKEFGNASVVITDRLHGMMFSLLAGTPCIVFDNATGKVFGVAEYLKKCGMPVYTAEELSLPMIEAIETKKQEYRLPEELRRYFDQLERIVNETENNR